ncbi:flagellar biosynthetic protein FliO [Geobacter sp. DSM 9736]|uniref:flagellar biosynthetic protein FliO n=1 Tax=Geobacter sp. DSM 9736 TaxID=1277350 RepID=UPI000B60948C|nr:flagellar biosynthetic protein FliO [Geobacter sp. DSM 9736]SNB47049.1 flagellar protein FliO/FliZ [Geobacter sp. DSM 9736]
MGRPGRGLIILLTVAMLPVFSGVARADQGFSLAGSFLQMIASLAVVIGVMLVVCYISNRWLRLGQSPGGARYIRLVESRYLAPKKSLMLVEVGGEYLLLGSSGEGMQFIKQIDMIEEIEIVSTPELAKFVPEGMKERVTELAGRFAFKPQQVPGKKVGAQL